VANLVAEERTVPVDGVGEVLLEWAPGTAVGAGAVGLPGRSVAVVGLREA